MSDNDINLKRSGSSSIINPAAAKDVREFMASVSLSVAKACMYGWCLTDPQWSEWVMASKETYTRRCSL